MTAPGVVEVACRPVDWSEVTQRLPVIDVPETPVYADSQLGACASCGTAVWVGPRQLSVMGTVGRVYVVRCFPCSILMHLAGGLPPIVCLNNPNNPGR